MYRSEALGNVQSVLDRVRRYVEAHDTFGDIAALNNEYVPTQLCDEVTWLSDMAERLLGADPNADDAEDAIDAPPPPSTTA